MLLSVPAGVLLAIALGQLSIRLCQPFAERVLTLFVFIYLIFGLLQVLEQIIFTAGMSLSYGAVFNVLPALALSLGVAWFWRPPDTNDSLRQALPRYFAHKRCGDWMWRLPQRG